MKRRSRPASTRTRPGQTTKKNGIAVLRVLSVSLLAMLWLLCALPVHAAGSSGDYNVPSLDYIAFGPGEAERSPQAILRSNDWQPTPDASPNFGYDDRTFWFRFSPGITEQRIERITQIVYPQLDDVRFYLVRDGEVIDELVTGDQLPYTSRAIQHPQFLFPKTLEPGYDYSVLIRVASDGAMQVPIRLWEPTALFETLSLQDQAHALYYGILLVIICFNLFIFYALRENTYLYYVLAIASYLLFMASLRGSAFAVLWPQSPWIHNQMMLITIPSAILFSALFVRAFLRLDHNNPVLDRIAKAAIMMGIIGLVGAFAFDYSTSTQLSVLLALPAFLILFIIGPIEWARGNRAAKFYTIAWAALSIGALLAALNKLGWLPTNFITEYGIQIGSAAEAILLTVALAERLYRERIERIRAQDQRLREHAERRDAELRLIDQALHHPITRLPNRTSFEMLVKDTIREEASHRHAIMVIQLTNYPDIQKTLGHSNTERLLETSARHIEKLARELPGIRQVEQTDRDQHWVASLESASFALLLNADISRRHPESLYQLIGKLREPFDFLGMQLPLNLTAGLAIYPDHGGEASTLIRRAFIAQESEEARLHHVAFYQLNRDVYSAERLTLAAELRQAMDENQLELHFQPQYRYRDDRISGFEGLLRWPNRKHPMAPDVIVAVAEETGLIKPLTRWVLERAIIMRRTLMDASHDLSVSVNISANNLREPDFPEFVKNLMEANRPYSDGLTLELTETSMMTDPISALKVLRTLRDAGIPIAIDDFGSGYSSLSYMKQLPATEIKIDKSLIDDITRHQDDRLIVRTTIEMSHHLGYRVVAEGVEDLETFELLRELGCDTMQGFHISRALSPADLIKWLHKGDQNHSKAFTSEIPPQGKITK